MFQINLVANLTTSFTDHISRILSVQGCFGAIRSVNRSERLSQVSKVKL